MVKSLIITHNAGFFSCCSVRLHHIVRFINDFKKLPYCVDSSKQFEWYKNKNDADITFDFFENYDNITNEIAIDENNIDYHQNYQFRNYQNLNYEKIIPLIRKYFTPSEKIRNIIDYMEQKYKLDYENICVLFYRGNDKITETELCGYDEYVTYANNILEKNQNVKFLIQSDETEFINFFSELFPHNSFYFKNQIRHMKRTINTVDKLLPETNHTFSKIYLAITIIMSRCKYIVCGSGNCSIWIMMYRGNADNVYQNLKRNWICP